MLAQLGRRIYRHRYYVLIAWVLALSVMLPVALRAQEKLLPGGFSNEDFPSSEARELLKERFGQSVVSLLFIVSHEKLEPYSLDFVAYANRLVAQLDANPNVDSVLSYLTEPGLISNDGRMAIITADLDLDIEDSLGVLDEITNDLDAGELRVVTTGAPPLYRDIVLASGDDFRRGEVVAFPLAAIALLLVFGTIVAAVMPIAVGGIAVAVGLGVIYYVADWRDMSVLAFNIITLLGIGMGIDYSLFYVKRFKEELDKGLAVGDAIAETHDHAGIAILFSGVTSIIGVSSLLLFDLTVLDSIGIGAIIVISVALLSAQTLMPALLGILGHRIYRFSVVPPWSIGENFWSRTAESIMRRPLLFLVPTIVLLVTLAVPFKDIQPGTVDATVLPKRFESRHGFDLLQNEFSWAITTELVIAYTFEGDPFSDENLATLYAFGQALNKITAVQHVSSIVNLRPTLGIEAYRELYRHPEAIYDAVALRLLNESVREGVALFYVSSDLHPFSPEARELVDEIRALKPPEGQKVYVDGGAAHTNDLVESLYGRFPIVAAMVILLTLLSLMVLFRSVVIPLKAVVLNVMSILASFGALVWVFQQGHFGSLLKFEGLGITEATSPIVLFAILFGLSMDYEIFLLARIKEAYQDTKSTKESVKQGLQRSGGIITGAGSILIIVSGSFVLAEVLTVKSIGFGLALAVFIDVTIVRMLVVPSLMTLLGRWNWWFPKWLDRKLPTVRAE